MMRMRVLGCLGLLGVAGCTPQPGGTVAPVAALQPGMARVWVLRQTSSGFDLAASNPNNPLPFAGGADPIVFVNGATLAPSAQGTAYYHDFPPGTYHFTVQPYGTPTNHVDTLELAAGTEAYVQVQPVSSWEVGAPYGGSFVVTTMPPQEAQAFISTLKDLGPR